MTTVRTPHDRRETVLAIVTAVIGAAAAAFVIASAVQLGFP